MFITPGSLTERFGFRARVFTSWITLGLALGLIFGIVDLSLGAATTGGAGALLINYLLQVPFALCFFGLVGLGIDAVSGRRAEYPGWYWWLFPIATYLFIGFWLAFAMIAFFLALLGVRLPQPSFHPPSSPNIDPKRFREEVEESKFQDFFKEFRKQLEQLEQLERPRKLEPEQSNVIRKLRSFDRSKYNSRLRDVFDEEELGELILMLLILLGVEVR